MKKILFILSLLTVLTSDAWARPNIVMVVTDDHGLDALGCYGNPVVQTSNMDKLAAEGVRFTRAYCTSASCTASRSVILTGKFGHATASYGHMHDYHHFSTYDHVKSLPVLLEAAGYHTARIGKYHVAPESVYHFQTVLKADPRSTIEMAEACRGVIKGDKPFFLYFCPDDPHRSHSSTPAPWNAPNTFGNRTEPYPGETQVKYDPRDVIVPSFLPDTTECREELAQYYQSVSRIDQGLGKLLEMLDTAGKTDNTIVIYISDNGIAFPGAKTTVYEPGIKLPCIVKDPRTDLKGLVNDCMISWVDLTPTILDFAEVDFKTGDFHGRSFRSILGKKDSDEWNTIYASHTFHEVTMYYPMRVVCEGDMKLIWNIAYQLPYPFASDLWAASTWQGIYRNKAEYFGKRTVQDYLHRTEFELYDLSKDPDEARNLAENPEYADVLEQMQKQIKSFQRGTSDPWQIMWGNNSELQGPGVNL